MTDDVERVKDALPSVAEMARDDGATLRETGREYRADHPHHTTDSTNGTNLTIPPDGGVWHCKRHDHGGDKLAWVAMSEGYVTCGDLDRGRIPSGLFRDVLQAAAERVGISLNDGETRTGDPDRLAADDTIRQRVAEYYHGKLDDHGFRGELKRRYGLSDEIIDENYIGYAPPPGADHDLPDATGADMDSLAELGLLAESGRPWFCDRFVFPYWVREAGDRRVRYFTARAVEHDGGPKYLKLSKGDDVAERATAEPPFGIETVRGSRRVVVTEGVTDALALHDHDIAAVSPVTTHISGEMLDDFAESLRGKDVFVVYDEDAHTDAGIEGAASDAMALYEAGVDCTVARLPSRPSESVDVADYFREMDGTRRERVERFEDEVLDGETYPPLVASWAWGSGGPWRVFAAALEELGYDHTRLVEVEDDEGDVSYLSTADVLGGANDLGQARREFYHGGSTRYTAGVHKECYHHVMRWVFEARGEFFKTEMGEVLYYHAPTNEMHTVSKSDEGKSLSASFRNLVAETFGITTGDWGRTLLETVADYYISTAPERSVARLFHYDADEGELYVSSFDGHYYALDGDGVERRRNGTDVFFRPQDRAEPYSYVPEADRPNIATEVPGERHPFVGDGDLVHRLLCNRVNYDESANLAPSLQRTQLYLHLHALAFANNFNGKPIMAWVGRKGSGKTMVLRSIGQFLYGPEWSEGSMPKDQDDFVTKVSNQTLAAIDNYDDGVDWANDLLAAIATGSDVEKRELYTTNNLARMSPECYLAVTSRDPPFRRDDVADRCLVFRVDRVRNGFVGETKYLKQPLLYRDELWSEYLDNLNAILRVRAGESDVNRTTSHRMADWALFAQDAGEALDVDHVDELLGEMQTERAFFALENEPMRIIIEEWLDGAGGGEYEASDLHRHFEKTASEVGVSYPYSTARGLSTGLRSLSDELRELFGMEIRERRRESNLFVFPGEATEYMTDRRSSSGGSR